MSARMSHAVVVIALLGASHLPTDAAAAAAPRQRPNVVIFLADDLGWADVGYHGFDHFWGHLHTNTDYYTHEREGGHDLQRNGETISEPGGYLTRLEAREAVRFIRERDKQRPLFLYYLPFTAPHSPMQAPEEEIEKYSHLPAKNYRRVYAAMVDVMDQAIGEVLDVLEEQGLADDTIVLFLSDNGGFNAFGGDNTPLRGQKGQTFEGGIRVPAVIRWPGSLTAGQVNEQRLAALDVLPTLATAAGVELNAPKALDGQDMWPAIAGGASVPREQPLFFASEIPIPGLISLAVLDGPWKLVQVVREGQTETRVRSFLFRIEEDPNEKENLAEKHPDVATRLAAEIGRWRSRHPLAGTRCGDLCTGDRRFERYPCGARSRVPPNEFSGWRFRS